MLMLFSKYLVFADGDFHEIKNATEFSKYFAPVKDEDEALAFATALTRSYPFYNVSVPAGYIKMSAKITHAHSVSPPARCASDRAGD